jgi:sarcosine oxidase delta subunit
VKQNSETEQWNRKVKQKSENESENENENKEELEAKIYWNQNEKGMQSEQLLHCRLVASRLTVNEDTTAARQATLIGE